MKETFRDKRAYENNGIPHWHGVMTAIVTPMKDGKIDKAAFKKLIKHGIDGGVHGIIVAGTTGEGATLHEKEKDCLTSAAVEIIDGKIPVLAGTGSLDTEKAVAATKRAVKLGVDGVLVVTPYYNKGTDAGIVSHYAAIADASTKPIMVYNVPSRTGVDLSLKQYEKIATHGNITAVKEAKGDIGKIAELVAAFADRLSIFTGNDGELLPILALGGAGVVSVLSNVFPKALREIYDAFIAGNTEKARALTLRYYPMYRLLFRETNPAPVKAALAECGLCRPDVRLPLSTVSEELKNDIAACLHRLT